MRKLCLQRSVCWTDNGEHSCLVYCCGIVSRWGRALIYSKNSEIEILSCQCYQISGEMCSLACGSQSLDVRLGMVIVWEWGGRVVGKAPRPNPSLIPLDYSPDNGFHKHQHCSYSFGTIFTNYKDFVSMPRKFLSNVANNKQKTFNVSYP